MSLIRKTALIFITVILAAGCSKNSDTAANDKDIFSIVESGRSVEMTTSGLMKDFKPVTREVVSVNSSGEENKMTVTGALLKDVLKASGFEEGSFNTVKPYSGDGYSIEIPEEIYKKSDVILAYKINGELLNEKSRPLRIIVPGERAMYWARNVVKLELLGSKESTVPERIVFLETVYKDLPQENYMHQGSYDPAVKVKDILDRYGTDTCAELYFKTSDGLERTETADNAMISFLRISGKSAPLFLSPDLPGGMYIKDIVSFSCGKTCFFSLEKSERTSAADILKDSCVGSSGRYMVTDRKNIKTELESSVLEAASVALEDSIWVLTVPGSGIKIKDVLSIEKAD